ncbi:MAG: PEGA domain-containing protein [Gammaproteobacteria bacterium]|nr:PEGA domain-containing protein [Gammaproteobacteria bacterium]
MDLHIGEVEQDDELLVATEVFNEVVGGEDSSTESNIELKINVDVDADLYANSIYIDRLHTGVNTIPLTPGKYLIKLVSDDQEEKTTEIELLNESVEELSFQMATASMMKIQPVAVKSTQKETVRKIHKVDVVPVGEVRIAVVPWGEILVNGKSFGVSPPVKLLKLNVGKHKVEIKNPGFKSFSTTIIVKEGEVANIRHQF